MSRVEHVKQTLGIRADTWNSWKKALLCLSQTRLEGLVPRTTGFVASRDGLRFWCETGRDYHVKFLPGFEPHMRDWIPRAESGDVFFDVGAHSGRYAVEACMKGYDVHCFEPHKETFAVLEKNLGFNKVEATCHNVAVGASRKGVGVTDKVHSGANTVVEDQDDVRMICLDDYSGVASDVRYVKVDVEGYENDVLRGGQRFLRTVNQGCRLQIETAHVTIDRALLQGWERRGQRGRDELWVKQ